MSATSDDLNPVVTAIELDDFEKLKRVILEGGSSEQSSSSQPRSPTRNNSSANLSKDSQQMYNASSFFQQQQSAVPPIHRFYAIFVGNVILSGEKLNVYQQQRFTALHLCVKYNRFDMVKFLVENGANVNAQAKMLEYQYREKLNAYVEVDVWLIFCVLVAFANRFFHSNRLYVFFII